MLSLAGASVFLWNIVQFINATMSKNWSILNWNVRGINSSDKWLALSNKIEESGCAILTQQETKRDHFDNTYLKKLLPKENK